MTRQHALARAGIIVTGAFLASRFLGWVRLVVIGTVFGAEGDLDAFFAAFRLPDLMFQLVAAGALGSALIPVLTGLFATDRTEHAWRVASTIANAMLVGLVAIGVVLFVAAPLVVPAITPGFDAERVEQTIGLTRIMLASPILLALGAVATSALQAQDRFAAAALAPIVYNLGIIGGAVILGPSMGVTGVAIGVVGGAAGHLLVQLAPLRAAGFRYRPGIDVGDPPTREAITLLVPRAIGLGANQITFIVATTLASGLGIGAITAYNFAFALLQLPVGVIGVPLGVIVFPSMARDLARGAPADYVRLLTRALRLIVFVMVPITALAMVLRRPIVAMLFGYGRFDERAIELTAGTFLFFLAGLTAHAAIAILARAFYARRDTRTPVLAALLAVAVNSSLAILLAGPVGLPGIAIAIAVGAWLEAAVLLAILRSREPGIAVEGLARALATSILAAVGAALVALGVLVALGGDDPGSDRIALILRTAVAAASGVGTYIAAALVLRIPELPSTIGVMRDIVQRRRPS